MFRAAEEVNLITTKYHIGRETADVYKKTCGFIII